MIEVKVLLLKRRFASKSRYLYPGDFGIVSRTKVVFHLFKKPLFSGSIENAIAFNTFSILRLVKS